MINTHDLNIKIAKWVRPRNVILSYKYQNYVDNIPLFSHSLDACEKWIFPKLEELNIRLVLTTGRGFTVSLKRITNGTEITNFFSKDIPVSTVVCIAIEKLIDKGL